jgi:hypothetical protein
MAASFYNSERKVKGLFTLGGDESFRNVEGLVNLVETMDFIMRILGTYYDRLTSLVNIPFCCHKRFYSLLHNCMVHWSARVTRDGRRMVHYGPSVICFCCLPPIMVNKRLGGQEKCSFNNFISHWTYLQVLKEAFCNVREFQGLDWSFLAIFTGLASSSPRQSAVLFARDRFFLENPRTRCQNFQNLMG